MHKEGYGSINKEWLFILFEEYLSINGKKVFKKFIFADEKDQVEIIYYSTNDKNKFLVELKCQGYFLLLLILFHNSPSVHK